MDFINIEFFTVGVLGLFLKRKNPFPIVLHADDDPAVLLRLGHERVTERADLRLGAISELAHCVIVMHQHH